MRPLNCVLLVLVSLGLGACVSPRPLDLTDDHPASVNAASGFVDTPTALRDYKTTEDFAQRAKEIPNDQGIAMHDMTGMDHGGAPHGAGDQ